MLIFYNDDAWKNLKQKLSIDEIYNISHIEAKLIILFYQNKHY